MLPFSSSLKDADACSLFARWMVSSTGAVPPPDDPSTNSGRGDTRRSCCETGGDSIMDKYQHTRYIALLRPYVPIFTLARLVGRGRGGSLWGSTNSISSSSLSIPPGSLTSEELEEKSVRAWYSWLGHAHNNDGQKGLKTHLSLVYRWEDGWG